MIPKTRQLYCKRCGSAFLHRSRTRAWERPLRLLLRPYRCRECRHRQHIPMWGYGAAFQKHPESLSLSQCSPKFSEVITGTEKVSSVKRPVLIYGLLTCLFLSALGVTFGILSVDRGLLNGAQWPSFKATSREEAVPKTQVLEVTRSSGSPTVSKSTAKVPPTPQTSNLLALPENASIESVKQRRRSPQQENTGASSPAEAIWAQRPELPPEIKLGITRDNVVDVQVRIDEFGTVTHATAVSAKGPIASSLIEYALQTARRWRFRPARENGKTVPSEKAIEFLFRASDT